MLFPKNRGKEEKMSIQKIIIWSFTVLMIVGMGFVGIVLYHVFNHRSVENMKTNSMELLQQGADHLEDYINNMQNIQDTLYQEIEKNPKIKPEELNRDMNLIYTANKDNLVSIACYTAQGEMLTSVPYKVEKKGANVVEQEWFRNALLKSDEDYISTPHIQRLFDINGYSYFWVVSLSKVVWIEIDGQLKPCVLIVDMNYNSIGKVIRELNENNDATYTYLIGDQGTVIYHPKANLISSGLFEENTFDFLHHSDGSWEEFGANAKRLITIKTLEYTEWKMIRVTPWNVISLEMKDMRYLVLIIIIITILILIFITYQMTNYITKPLEELTDSIKIISDDGLPKEISVGGSSEVEYLGKSLKKLVNRIRILMDDIVKEQEEKRRSELDALQSQINPHFLYNTLDSIIWMIEGEKYQDAIFMIRQLASLFRISLSKGKTMITIKDELQHAKNYMNIQKVRYRNRFEIDYEVDPEILSCVTVKLVLQPILENALYYAVEALDGDGEIIVKGFREDKDIYLQVIDNGMGMTKEMVDHLLEEKNHLPKKGSGVGLINIHKRLQIRFGDQYGLHIESELDEGTTVTLHLPYQLYEEGESYGK